MKTERVLQIVLGLNQNGIDNMVMDLYRHIDRSAFQFDFVLFGNEEGVHEKEALKLGARVFHLPRRSKNYFRSAHELKAVMRRGNYRIVHAHQDCLSGSVLKLAQKEGVPIRIAHAHTTQYPSGLRRLYYYLAKQEIPKYATHFIACTEQSGAWMFGDDNVCKTKILTNAVDVSKFAYSASVRKQVRQEKGLSDKAVLLNIGRLAYAKNQAFLLDVVECLLPKLPNLKLLLVGAGELETDLKQACADRNLDDYVIFYGASNEVSQLLQAADVFLLPSLFEGLPLTGIEAQVAGLPLLLSAGIDPKIAFTPLANFFRLSSGADHWADQVLRLLQSTEPRRSYEDEARKNGFDIGGQADLLASYYREFLYSLEGGEMNGL